MEDWTGRVHFYCSGLMILWGGLLVQVFLFGSFSESEAKTFQSPPVAVKHDSLEDGNLLPAIQFGDLTEQVVSVTGKPTSSVAKLDLQSEISHKSNGGSPRSPDIQFPLHENGVAAPSKLLSSQPETTPVLESVNEDGPVIKEIKTVPTPATEVETACELKTSNEVVEPETSKLPQKSWAALVGVHQTPGDGLKNPGQVKNARVAGNNKPAPEGSRRVQPRGLLNTGNSCFANATLQALLSCPPFLDLLHGIQARAVPQVGVRYFFLVCYHMHTSSTLLSVLALCLLNPNLFDATPVLHVF